MTTAEAIAQVREALERWPKGFMPFLDRLPVAALTALDSLEAEVERLTKLELMLRREVDEHAAAVQHASDLQNEAEAEVERLTKECERLHDPFEAEMEKLRDENERLRAVVEAAEELQAANRRANRTRPGWTEAERVALSKVRLALAALDAEESSEEATNP